MSEFSASPERLILGALLGFAVLLFLIINAKALGAKDCSEGLFSFTFFKFSLFSSLKNSH